MKGVQSSKKTSELQPRFAACIILRTLKQFPKSCAHHHLCGCRQPTHPFILFPLPFLSLTTQLPRRHASDPAAVRTEALTLWTVHLQPRAEAQVRVDYTALKTPTARAPARPRQQPGVAGLQAVTDLVAQ